MEAVLENIYSPISEAYDGMSILVTGVTGFLGKVLLEKILYSCPKVAKMYILIREKKGASAEERVKKMLDTKVFQRLKNERPQDLDKIIPINGDIALPNLGLTLEEKKVLVDTVSMVFHFAATVKFNESLQYALNINFEGTKRLLEMCKSMPNIKVFVHISTTFCHLQQELVREIIYPPPITLDEADHLTQNELSDEDVAKIMSGWPNSYTFTKALAENLVKSYHGDVPCVIIRPSAVVSSRYEPVVGWMDSWNGVVALITPIARGLNRVLLTRKDNNFDMIPVDYVANLAIVAAARYEKSNDIQVYNSCTSSCNRLTEGTVTQLSIKESVKQGFNIVPWPSIILTESTWMLAVITFLQRIPVLLLDILMCITGKKPRLLKAQSQAVKFRDSMEYFISRTWTSCAERACALAASLSEEDQVLFPCDPRNIVWTEFISTYVYGLRTFLFPKDKKT